MRGAMVRVRCVLVTSKPEGIGLLLGLCDGLFAHGEGRSGDICGCSHGGRRKRGRPDGKVDNRVEIKYPMGLHNPTCLSHSPTPFSFSES